MDLKHTVYLETPPEETIPEELRAAAAGCMADLLTLCEEHGLPPRAIVYSGHGLQLYWARRARSTFGDTEAFNRGLAKRLDGDPAATDQARILRVPGWLHHKNLDRPLPVELWHQDAQAWVEDTALEPHALHVQAYERSSDVFLNKGAVSDADLDVLQAAWHDVTGHTYDFKGNGRHQLALWTGGWLRTNGHAEADALELVHQLASTAVDPALQDRLRAVRDAYRTENPKGWTGLTVDLGLPLGCIPMKEAPKPKITGANPEKTRTQPTPEPGDKPTLPQYAQIFQAYNQEHVYEYAYHEQWQRWFEYQQGVYLEVPDTTLRKRLDLVMQEAGYANLKKADLNEILLKVAHTPGIGKPRTDQGKWELNVTNGILDLESLDLAPHSSEYFIVVQAKAAWTPDSGCPDWAEFLTSAVPSREDRETLQRFCGYALTGDTSAQKALLLIGEGGLASRPSSAS